LLLIPVGVSGAGAIRTKGRIVNCAPPAAAFDDVFGCGNIASAPAALVEEEAAAQAGAPNRATHGDAVRCIACAHVHVREVIRIRGWNAL
jgi:hypothetical protein